VSSLQGIIMGKILLVDDDVNFRRSLMIQLELEGYMIDAEENGREALRFLENSAEDSVIPNIIISDLKMPKMNGEDFIKAVTSKYPTLPVLVISAFDLPDSMQGHRFLRKPFKIEEIVTAIEDLIHQDE